MERADNQIIVSLTSWMKRIGNVSTVVNSLIDQSLQPDKIEINLSVVEFPNKMDDMPIDLKDIVTNNPIVNINWVNGNDGVFKKFIPTLKKYPFDEFYLLSCDDDWIYRNDYVKTMMFYLNHFKADTFCLANAKVIGNRQIYKPGTFQPDFWNKLTREVIDTRIDDMYIEHYLTSKGKKFSSFRPEDTPEITKRYNQMFPNSHNDENGEYDIADVKHAANVIKRIKFDPGFAARKINPTKKEKTFVIINYNTQDFVDKLIMSINKFVNDAQIIVFDNSDRSPFKNTFPNVMVIDNTKEQIIDFKKFLQNYPNRIKSSARGNNFASAKHCITVEKCIELVNENFILLDSDVLLKKDVSDCFDDSYVCVGTIGKQPNGIKRMLPYLCFINVDMCKKFGIHYFDERYMHGLCVTTQGDGYDTGGGFLMNINGHSHKEININEYIIHYGHGSWTKQGYTSKSTKEDFFNDNKDLWKTK